MTNPNIEEDNSLVLVVDDELVGRIYIEQALRDEGYEVISAENGRQAIELVAEQEPDLVVMDVMMPEMDGYTACRAIRESETNVQTPILMLTGLDDVESVEKSFNAGATDFVVKPVNLPIFKQRIRYGLATHKGDLAFHKQQQRLLHAQSVAQMGYWDWDIENNNIYWSDEVYKILSVPVSKSQHENRDILAKVHPDDRKKVSHAIQLSLDKKVTYCVEHRVLRHDQKMQVVSQHAELVKNDAGDVVRMLGIIQDVTEKYLSQQEIWYLAYYDGLTDLPNRVLFCERLEEAINLLDDDGDEVAIFIIDLDRFKNINNALGHDIGDEFLAGVAKGLKEMAEDIGQVGKFSGVKFGFFIEKDTSRERLSNTASRLLNVLCEPCEVRGNELVCTGSIGVVVSSPDNRDVKLLLHQAERALSESKDNGGNRYSFYSEKMKSYAHQLLTIERELRYALERNEFVVYYQPKCCVATGRIVGMEALVRWHHPKKGRVPPDQFISVAEETGLIVPIGKWVLEEACKQTVKWHRQGYERLVVSVNVSVRQFHHKGFCDEVLATVEEACIDPRCVDLEITESCTMNSFEKAIRLLERFREKGIRISMDDFGTGFSSLSFLQKLPLDTLKVDREFIRDIGVNGDNGELAKLIIAVAKELKLSVVAEGVETQNHLDFLVKGKCDEYQGYFLSPALPANQFEELLLENWGEVATHKQ